MTPPRRVIDEQERSFVEDFGMFFEQLGGPRMAGRIVGRLLVAEPPEQSSAQLMRYLDASKASISTMTRYLIQLGLIDRVGVPGERIDHFRLRAGAFARLTEARVRQTSDVLAILERGLELPVAQANRTVRRRLEEVRGFYEFFRSELLETLQRYEKGRSKPRRR